MSKEEKDPKNDPFADLPDEKEESSESSESSEEEEEEELTDLEKNKLRDLSIAEKKEKKRITEAERKLKETRTKRKETEARANNPEEGEKEKKTEDEIKKIVEQTLLASKKDEYLASVAEEIKKYAKNKAEAIAAYEEAKILPPSWDASLDAKFAFDRMTALKEARRGYVSPAISGSFADMGQGTESPSGFSKSQIEILKNAGLSDEEMKKYKGGSSINNIPWRR